MGNESCTGRILFSLSTAEKARVSGSIWEEARKRALRCSSCPLSKTRSSVVFGEGCEKTSLMFIGEGPGADEDAQGRPFVGRAGQIGRAHV